MTYDYDSILTATDSNVISQTEFYHQGVTLPDHTVAMAERAYAVGNDDYVVGGMVVMFFLLALILYRSRTTMFHRLKDFFSTKRQYVEERGGDNGSEALNVFLLISISALSLSLIFLDDLMEQGGFTLTMGIPYWLFAAGVVVVLCFVYLKLWLYMLVNWVFFDHESAHRWLVGYLLMTSLTAFLFYSVALFDVFSYANPKVVSVSAILVVFLYEMLLFYKLLANFKVKKYGYLLIILYFCSVEIIPALVLGHAAGWISDNVIVKNLLY